MRQLYADEVTMTFESNGIPPIVELLVSQFYIPSGNLLLYRRGIWRQHVINSLLPTLNDRGRKLYKDDSAIKKAATDFRAYGKTLSATCERVMTSGTIGIEDFEQLISESAQYMREYEYFDSWNTDGAYPFREDSKVAAALEFAEHEKNVMREEFGAMFFEKGKAFLGALEHMAAQIGINPDDIAWYWVEEIKNAFAGLLRTDQENRDRRRAYAYFFDADGSFAFLDGDSAERYIEQFESKQNIAHIAQLRGQTANLGQGIVRGAARIINSDYLNFAVTQAAMDAMYEGDILIAPTTAPDLMPALRKAAAIITDVGGMLSHAALTARELGKPCIVGTKIASRVFKDGDLVEVDADNGIVRRI